MYVMLLVVEQPKHTQHAGIKKGKADKCLINVFENCVFNRQQKLIVHFIKGIPVISMNNVNNLALNI